MRRLMTLLFLPSLLLLSAGCACLDTAPGLDDDDDDATVFPDLPDPIDNDDDGFDEEEDCDDDNPDVYPGAPEVCDDLDNDCDGVVDEDENEVPNLVCDEDGDGFLPGDDCDDTDADVFPGADELCNGIDDDCDSETDEGFDGNGDGLPDCVDDDGDGYSPDDGDCDDSNPALSPGAEEPCDGVDNDCDGLIDEETDVDGDGTPDCSDFCPVYVDLAHADPTEQDGTWTWPFAFIQDGMDQAVANNCRYVDVYPGTYVETIDFGGHDLEVFAVGGRSDTIIDGNNQGSTVTAHGNEPSTAKLEGFTVRGGLAESGGGIDIHTSDLSIIDNEVTDNVAEHNGVSGAFGGGIGLAFSESLVMGNLIHNNQAGLDGPEEGCDGGGIAVVFGGPEIFDNTVADNVAGDGGGIWIAKSDTEVYNNLVANNVARDQGAENDYDGGQGGGINLQSSSTGTLVANNVVWDNEADEIGGGIAVYEYNDAFGNGAVVNNTVCWNDVGDNGVGAGLAVWVNLAPDVHNNIVFGNNGAGVQTHETAVTNAFGTSVQYSYNLVAGNEADWAGAVTSAPATNFGTAAAFVGASNDGDWENDDFHLGASSPGVNQGDPAAIYNDADGSQNDVGAYGGPDGSW